MTTIPILAWLAILPAACLSWRWSRVVPMALAMAFASTGAYLLASRIWPEAHASGAFEWQRWVSAAAGLAGVAELARRGTVRGRFVARWMSGPAWPRHLERAPRAATIAHAVVSFHPRTDVLAALLVGSMAADGAAHLIHRGVGLWVMPAVQLAALGVMCIVGAWPERRLSP